MLRRWDLFCQLNSMDIGGYKPVDSLGAFLDSLDFANMMPKSSFLAISLGDDEESFCLLMPSLSKDSQEKTTTFYG